MGINIVYFSRTNKTKKLALELEKQLNGKVFEIKDDKSWDGFLGFIRAGFFASFDRQVSIDYNEECLDCKKIIIMSPTWAGGPVPAVREFIRQNENRMFDMVMTNDGSSKEKLFSKIDKLFSNIDHKWLITKNEKEHVFEEINDNYRKI